MGYSKKMRVNTQRVIKARERGRERERDLIKKEKKGNK
jgi:hypothetical protein